MAISVYDILKQKQEIEDQHDTFKQCVGVLPVECDTGARIFKEFGETIKEIIRSGALDLPAEASGLNFMNTLYIFKNKALEIERLFYKLRLVCLDNSKKKEELYETLYNELHEITEQLDEVAGMLPPRPTNTNDGQETTNATETKGDENGTQILVQPSPYFTRTSTSTF